MRRGAVRAPGASPREASRRRPSRSWARPPRTRRGANIAGRARVDRGGRDPGATRVDRVALEDGRAVLCARRRRRRRGASPPHPIDATVFATTKQLITHTSSPASCGHRPRPGRTARRPRAARARPSRPPCRRRRSPPGPERGRSPSTSARRSSRFWSTVVLLQFDPGLRQNWHQHHFGSPPAANSSASAGQVADVMGSMSTSVILADSAPERGRIAPVASADDVPGIGHPRRLDDRERAPTKRVASTQQDSAEQRAAFVIRRQPHLRGSGVAWGCLEEVELRDVDGRAGNEAWRARSSSTRQGTPTCCR